MNHTRNHYIIAGLAVLLAVGGTAYVGHRVDSLPAARTQPFAWPGLSPDQQTALTASLGQLGKQDVTVWCATANCTDLAEDLQYVAYMAGWDTHAERPIAGDGPGINVAPDDATGVSIAKALSDVLGRPVGLYKSAGAPGHSIVIGAKQ